MQFNFKDINNKNNNIAIAILIGSSIIALSLVLKTVISAVFSQSSLGGVKAEKAYENITYVKTENSPILGDKNAPVRIVEYTDFDCPICLRVYAEVLPSLKKDFINQGKVSFVYKSYPLEYLHKTAHLKAEATYCAKDQGGDKAFFQYYDNLFINFGNINNDELEKNLVALGGGIGLNTSIFSSCMRTGVYKERVSADRIEALVIGATGTPTWLIGKNVNGKLVDTVKITGLTEYEVYKTVIEKLLSN